jgi:hypothetical protein
MCNEMSRWWAVLEEKKKLNSKLQTTIGEKNLCCGTNFFFFFGKTDFS